MGHVISASFPKFNLKCRQLISTSKLESVAFVFGLEPKASLSLEVGGVISEDVSSTCSDWTLVVLGATGKNDILMLSPLPPPYWPYALSDLW